MVQSNKFKGDYLGLVAGFVETGETLEECVHREVMEETHISIKTSDMSRVNRGLIPADSWWDSWRNMLAER